MVYRRFDIASINKATYPHLSNVSKAWETEEYIILYDTPGKYKHLRIRRQDNKPIHNFMDIQKIKNDLFGKNVAAIEVYPKQTNLKNGSNTYHIWTWKLIEVPNLKDMYKYKESD